MIKNFKQNSEGFARNIYAKTIRLIMKTGISDK
jgi:hypothetical protein